MLFYFCSQVNETPAEYYCNMDSQGGRADKYQKPELCLGAYEFIATTEYCKNKTLPKEPAIIFVMEMSQLLVQKGKVQRFFSPTSRYSKFSGIFVVFKQILTRPFLSYRCTHTASCGLLATVPLHTELENISIDSQTSLETICSYNVRDLTKIQSLLYRQRCPKYIFSCLAAVLWCVGL